MKPRSFELDSDWTQVAHDVYVRRVFGYDFLLDLRDDTLGHLITDIEGGNIKTTFDHSGNKDTKVFINEIMSLHFSAFKEEAVLIERPYVAVSIAAFVDKAPRWKRYLRKILNRKVLHVAHASLHSLRREFALAGVDVVYFNPVPDVSIEDQYDLSLTSVRKVPYNDVKGTFWDADDILWTFTDVEDYLDDLRNSN